MFIVGGCASAPEAQAPNPRQVPKSVQIAPKIEPQAHPGTARISSELKLATEYLREAIANGAAEIAPEALERAKASLARAKAARSPAEKEDLAQTAAFDAKWVRNLTVERKNPPEARAETSAVTVAGSPTWLLALAGVGIVALGGFALTLARRFTRPVRAAVVAKLTSNSRRAA